METIWHLVELPAGGYKQFTLETWDLICQGTGVWLYGQDHSLSGELEKRDVEFQLAEGQEDDCLQIWRMSRGTGQDMVYVTAWDGRAGGELARKLSHMAVEEKVKVRYYPAGVGGGETPLESFSLNPLVEVMSHLRSPGGCLWDIEQTHASLRRYMVEEVYEVLEAIDQKDAGHFCEELGDLLLQIVFHARVAEESGAFTMQDVINQVTEKMIRRHPHVFGTATVASAGEVIVNWEIIKGQEKGNQGRHSVLDGVSKGLPGLLRAYKLQSKAAKVGFDWPEVEPVWEKVKEELEEFRREVAGPDRQKQEEELGDLLFSVVNLARFYHIEPETALHVTNQKFIRRFAFVEEQVKAAGGDWRAFSLGELDLWWEKAKKTQK